VNRRFRPAAWLLLSFVSPRLLLSQQIVQINYDVTLSAFAFRYTGPQVFTDSYATVYDRGTGNQVRTEVILGHQVNDLTNHFILYQGRFVSDTGSASIDPGALPGSYNTCYDAKMAAHVNAFNIHVGKNTDIQCMEVVDTQPPPPPKENCPILLDLRLNGFHLSGPDPAVRFDIDADGAMDQIAWTQAGEDEAFLCLDRNHNGVIDDGRELFGYATPLLSGKRAQVGYRALAELDGPELGGNQDGKVDGRDPLFRELCAWIDTNRDGISQADEVHSLEDVGVAALDYDYKPTRIRDQYGNLFRYKSRVEMRSESGGLASWPTYDVIFTEP